MSGQSGWGENSGAGGQSGWGRSRGRGNDAWGQGGQPNPQGQGWPQQGQQASGQPGQYPGAQQGQYPGGRQAYSQQAYGQQPGYGQGPAYAPGGGPQPPKKSPLPWILGGVAAVLVIAVVGFFLWPKGTTTTAPAPGTSAPAPAPASSGRPSSAPAGSSAPATSSRPSGRPSADTSQYKNVETAKLPASLPGGYTRDTSADRPGASYADRAYYKGAGGNLVQFTATKDTFNNTLERVESNSAFVPFERFGEVTCGQSKLSTIGPVCFQLLNGGVLMSQGPKDMAKQQLADISKGVYAQLA